MHWRLVACAGDDPFAVSSCVLWQEHKSDHSLRAIHMRSLITIEATDFNVGRKVKKDVIAPRSRRELHPMRAFKPVALACRPTGLGHASDPHLALVCQRAAGHERQHIHQHEEGTAPQAGSRKGASCSLQSMAHAGNQSSALAGEA